MNCKKIKLFFLCILFVYLQSPLLHAKDLSVTQIEGAYFVDNNKSSTFLANDGPSGAFRIQLYKGKYYLYFGLYGRRKKTLLKKIGLNEFGYKDKDENIYNLNLNNYTISSAYLMSSKDVDFRIFYKEETTYKSIETIKNNKTIFTIAMLVTKSTNPKKEQKLNIYYEVIYSNNLTCHGGKLINIDALDRQDYSCSMGGATYHFKLQKGLKHLAYSVEQNNKPIQTVHQFKQVINEFKIW